MASMEPGRKGREYLAFVSVRRRASTLPQWSPAAKAGNTASGLSDDLPNRLASMEPGRKGREYTHRLDE